MKLAARWPRSLSPGVALFLDAPLFAHAHAGHAATGTSHWHATDFWGVLAVSAWLAAALWNGRNK
jgi:hypothetical protein